MRHIILALAPVLILAGCVPPIAPGSCPAPNLQSLIGKPEGSLAGMHYTPKRIIHPGEMVTMDFVPSRLNVRIDAAGNISAITCG